MTMLLALPLAVGGLTACDGWVESYCDEGEVYVEYAQGGADCRAATSADPRCQHGRVLRERPGGRLDCIVDDTTADPDPIAPASR